MEETFVDEAKRWQRRAKRERQARFEAESIAETATLELYASNQALNIANRKLTETSETLYLELFSHNPLPMYVVDRDKLRFLEVNETAQRHYGFDRDEFLGMTLRDIEPLSELRYADSRRAALDLNQHDTGLWHHVTSDGRAIEVELSVHSLAWRDQPALLLVARDVTVQRNDRRTLELRTKAIESSHNGVFICSAQVQDFPVLYVNAAMEEYSGNSREALSGRSFTELFPSENISQIERMVSVLRAKESVHSVIALPIENGKTDWLEAQITPVLDDEGIAQHWIGIVQDISERKTLEETLAYRAHHDALTGLPNRELLRQRLELAVETASLKNQQVATLFLDFDKFKQVNDIGGHDVGDQYLKILATRLRNSVRETDTLARIGGDEFVWVTTGSDLTKMLPEFAERLQEAVSKPVTIAGQVFSAHCSMGVAIYPVNGQDADTLLKRADMTMYTAKRKGGHTIEWFSPATEAIFHREAEIQIALQRAVEKEEFELHYQPQIDMRGGDIVGLEALIRWPEAPDGYGGPADFIPAAEESGLIRDIGAWVLQRACADLARLRADGYQLSMAINVSALQLRDANFAEDVTALLTQHALPPDALEIEITESVLMTERDTSEATLARLNEMGVRLAIDDFGIGYSSLSYIRRIPVQRIKIDRSFIKGMSKSDRDSELVRTVASMAHSLNLEPLAEGVETDTDVNLLLGYDCFFAQGYRFGRALPINRIAKIMAARQS